MADAPFSTTHAFVAWMQEVYLAELVLLSAKPKPGALTAKKPPKRVVLVWGQRDLSYTGARDRFEVWTLTCDAVEQWHAEGELDSDAELTVAVVPDAPAPIALRMDAGGTATLVCGQIAVVESAPVLRKALPRPWRHDFTMDADDTERTVGELLAHANASELASLDATPIIAAAEWKLAELGKRSARAWRVTREGEEVAIVATVFRHTPGWTLHVQRTKAADAAWEPVWQLPWKLGAQGVRSRTLATDAEEWKGWDFRRGAKG
jgi:hypothetical protein